MRIPLTIHVPVWYTEEEGEVILDREEMFDGLQRLMDELEERANKKLIRK